MYDFNSYDYNPISAELVKRQQDLMDFAKSKRNSKRNR